MRVLMGNGMAIVEMIASRLDRRRPGPWNGENVPARNYSVKLSG